jgi:hypothetical protein
LFQIKEDLSNATQIRRPLGHFRPTDFEDSARRRTQHENHRIVPHDGPRVSPSLAADFFRAAAASTGPGKL